MPLRFSDADLKLLLEQGLHPAEIARRFGVSRSAVCQRAKKLKVAIADRVTREAIQIVTRKLDAMRELEKINHVIERELDAIGRELETAVGSDRIMALRSAQIQHTAEIRKQIELLVNLFRTLYDAEGIRQFQQTVLEVIKEVDPNVQQEILRRLQTRRALGSFPGLPSPGNLGGDSPE